MDELNAQVLKGFGIKARRIIKEKAYYICDTGHGLRVIRRSLDSCDNIFFQYEIKEHLHESGFACTDRYYMSRDGKPYFALDDSTYVMTDMFEYRESDFGSPAEFSKIVGQTAMLHKLARGISFTGKMYYGRPDMAALFKKSLSEITAIKKKMSSQSKYSDFDVLFIKNYNYYMKQLKSSIHMLENTLFHEYFEIATKNTHVCHNSLKEENILINKEDVHFVKFGNAEIDCQMCDLCSIIRRHVKASSGEVLPLWRVLDIYDQFCSISQEEVNILYPLLRYPHNFIKICGQYYSKKRTWTPNAIINRMEAVLAGKDDFERYIDG